MKRNHNFEERKQFATGLQSVLKTVIDKYVKEELKKECELYLIDEFSKVQNFSNCAFIEECNAKQKEEMENKKIKNLCLKKEQIKLEMETNLKDNFLKNYDLLSLDDNYNIPLEEALKKIEEYKDKIKYKTVEILYYYLKIGGYLKQIKELFDGSTLDFKKFIESYNVEYSLSTAYFYIDLFNPLEPCGIVYIPHIQIFYLPALWYFRHDHTNNTVLVDPSTTEKCNFSFIDGAVYVWHQKYYSQGL